MEERELRAVFGKNIRKYRKKRGWSQLFLSEKLDISPNFLSEIETGKNWVSPLTLVKLANALEIDVSAFFMSVNPKPTNQNELEIEKMKRFAKDLALALDASTAEVTKTLKNTVEKVCKEYLR